MFAYVDETGNTGPNIFDEAQPDFFTGALITKTNFDLTQKATLARIGRKSGADTFHAAEMGAQRIEEIAPDVLRLLKKVDARFFISRVEKRYLLVTKFFDTFFDSGENPAANWAVYNIRVLKLMLCFKVATILTDEIAREFWSMLMARNEKIARTKIPGICNSVLANVGLIADARSREVITDSLSWCRSHPEALDIFIAGRQAKNGHMPNMVAFANLLDGLEMFSKRWNRPLRKIVHDRQSQFESSLEEWHRMFSNASGEAIELPGETFTMRRVPGSSFEVCASDASAGIQIADLILWLYRQYIAGKILPAGCSAILSYALKKGYHNDFSFSGVGEHVESRLSNMMGTPISSEALRAGRDLIEMHEVQRQRLIELYEEDGLMPYERMRPPQLS